jgi:predicted amidohydrolase
MSILATHEEFDVLARRFMRQTKAARLVVFPELMGVMLAAPMISGVKLGFVKRADEGRKPRAGFMARGVGRVADATAGALGGGFAGSMKRLLGKDSDSLRDVYVDTFGRLAREFGVTLVAGSLYLQDDETGLVRNRSYVFDGDGSVLGYQDKLNLTPAEAAFASPGEKLTLFETWFGRLGILLGRDALIPELARALAVRGADLLVGPSATPGAAQARAVRSAMVLRAEENQVFASSAFMLGPNYLDPQNREDYYGQSAVLAPISLSAAGDGVRIQAGTHRTEGVVVAELDADAMETLRETSRFRPRMEMQLGDAGPWLAEFYRRGQSIDDAVAQQRTVPAPIAEPFQMLPLGADEVAEEIQAETALPEAELEPPEAIAERPEADDTSEPALPEPEMAVSEPDEPGPEADDLLLSVPEAMSLSGPGRADKESD